MMGLLAPRFSNLLVTFMASDVFTRSASLRPSSVSRLAPSASGLQTKGAYGEVALRLLRNYAST